MPVVAHRYPGRVAMLLPGALLLLTVITVSRAQASPQEISIRLGDYHFTPDTFEVRAGRAVVLTLTNTDMLTPHNFTLQDTAAGLDIDTNISAGSKAVIKFTPVKPGTYTFFCNKKLFFMKSHRERGMEGTLHVLPPATQ
jgi:plastocyanin